jgi:hypothetical protein
MPKAIWTRFDSVGKTLKRRKIEYWDACKNSRPDPPGICITLDPTENYFEEITIPLKDLLNMLKRNGHIPSFDLKSC